MSFARSLGLRSACRPARALFQPRLQRPYSSSPSYEHIVLSEPKPGVGMVTLNRPKALNALCTPLMTELNDALRTYDANPSIGAMVLTGSEKAFAAGADIKEMSTKTFSEAYGHNFIADWSSTITALRKPLIAAVNGYALGGGCELAMMADIMYVSTTTKLGQPEITLGIIPGAGGSQRLCRAVGKSKAMELILTGKQFTGADAVAWGVAAECFAGAQECVDGAVATAARIASFSTMAVVACKEVVDKSQELPLREGIDFERRVFHGLFGSKDQKVGMEAFVNKQKPEWTNE